MYFLARRRGYKICCRLSSSTSYKPAAGFVASTDYVAGSREIFKEQKTVRFCSRYSYAAGYRFDAIIYDYLTPR